MSWIKKVSIIVLSYNDNLFVLCRIPQPLVEGTLCRHKLLLKVFIATSCKTSKLPTHQNCQFANFAQIWETFLIYQRNIIFCWRQFHRFTRKFLNLITIRLKMIKGGNMLTEKLIVVPPSLFFVTLLICQSIFPI